MAREMKDSGYEWIESIPEKWEIKKLKNIGTFSSSGIDKKIDENEIPIKIINYVDVYHSKTHLLKDKDYMIVTTTAEKKEKHCVNKGDLIFTPSSETIEDIGISALVAETMRDTAFSYHVLRFQFKINVNESYKKYLCNNSLVRNYFSKCATGTIRKTLSRKDFDECCVILPSNEEQKIIAYYLDEKIQEIDNAIEMTNLTINDYKKFKQSIITDAVSKGVRKQQLRDTGNIHIPEIPNTWDMKKIKYVFFIKKNIAGKSGYDVLSITQKGIKIKDITSNAGQLAVDYSNYQLVNIGDFAMNHMDLLTGWVDVSQYNGVTSPDYRVFNFISEEGYSRRYYLYLMQMCYMNRIFYGLGQGVSNLGRWRLQADKFLNFTIPVPSYEEQVEIAEYLDIKCKEIEKLITEKEALIVDLENYKKSLIYEYVTGKKEVPTENAR